MPSRSLSTPSAQAGSTASLISLRSPGLRTGPFDNQRCHPGRRCDWHLGRNRPMSSSSSAADDSQHFGKSITPSSSSSSPLEHCGGTGRSASSSAPLGTARIEWIIDQPTVVVINAVETGPNKGHWPGLVRLHRRPAHSQHRRHR